MRRSRKRTEEAIPGLYPAWKATQEASMGSSREYWQYARECARWAAQSKDQEDQDLFINMAKAWTNIALVEGDVRKLVPEELRASERPN
jgi:hypothetical protein